MILADREIQAALERGAIRMPPGWRMVPLRDICHIEMGQSPPSATYNRKGEGWPLLNGPTEFGPKHPRTVQWTTQPSKFAEPGDILFCVRGATTGRKSIADQRYCIGRGLAAIRGKEGLADTNFLWFLLDVVTESLVQRAAGSTFVNLPGAELEAFRVPLPALDEQRRIAAVLQGQMAAVERARAAVEARLEAAKALPAVCLRSVFDDARTQGLPKCKLGTLLQLRREVIHPRDKPVGRATFVGHEHIQSGTGRRVGGEEVQKEELTGRKPQFYKGDIVYGYLRPYLNKVWVAEFDGLCSVDQYVFIVRTDKADKEFLAWFMRSPVYLERAPVDLSPGQLPRIRTEEVAATVINLPGLKEQRALAAEISSRMERILGLIGTIQQEHAAINTLATTLLRYAFKGEL